MRCADHSYAILEGRSSIGGVRDLFRYPGVRSDLDMYTLGYAFKPWEERKAIADSPSIFNYVRDTARENDIKRHIRFGHQVKGADWSSADFAGRVVHLQQRTDDVAYAGKRVVVIGSGATAVTLVPELAKQAAHVTMLQRSPTYILASPSEDALANQMRRWLPGKLAYSFTRCMRVLLGMYIFALCRSNPAKVKRLIAGGVRMVLGPDYDVAKHFTPRYNPWNQRLCLAPDGDFFAAIKSGSASVVTAEIERFTQKGLALKSGAHLDADLIVTATGLNL